MDISNSDIQSFIGTGAKQIQNTKESIIESNSKRECNTIKFGPENVTFEEEDFNIKYLLLGMRD